MSYKDIVEIDTKLDTPAKAAFENRVPIKNRLYDYGVIQETGIIKQETIIEVLKE